MTAPEPCPVNPFCLREGPHDEHLVFSRETLVQALRTNRARLRELEKERDEAVRLLERHVANDPFRESVKNSQRSWETDTLEFLARTRPAPPHDSYGKAGDGSQRATPGSTGSKSKTPLGPSAETSRAEPPTEGGG